MDESGNARLAPIWADATPLAKFMEQRAEQLCRRTPNARRSDPGMREAGKLSSIEQFARSMEAIADLRVARDRARMDTHNDLVAGRLVGIGRPSDSYKLESIEASYWIGARVEGDTVARDGRTIVEVRIVLPDAIPSIQPKPQSGPGRPSEVEVIKAAIVDYAKTDPALKRGPSTRRRAYRTYIASRGYDLKDPGFSEKTLQKYETDFRRGKFK